MEPGRTGADWVKRQHAMACSRTKRLTLQQKLQIVLLFERMAHGEIPRRTQVDPARTMMRLSALLLFRERNSSCMGLRVNSACADISLTLASLAQTDVARAYGISKMSISKLLRPESVLNLKLCAKGGQDLTTRKRCMAQNSRRYIPASPTLRTRPALGIGLGSDVAPDDHGTSNSAVPVERDGGAISPSAQRAHDMKDPVGALPVMPSGIYDQEQTDAMEAVLQTLCNNEWIRAAAREATQDLDGLDAQCWYPPNLAGGVEAP